MTAWTQEQTELARKMIHRNAPDSEFRAKFGKSKVAARSRVERESFRTMRSKMLPVRTEPAVTVPPEVLADLETRKKSLRSMSPGAILMGDPEPGRRRF